MPDVGARRSGWRPGLRRNGPPPPEPPRDQGRVADLIAERPAEAGAGYLRQFFTRVRSAATLSNAYGVRNQEWGGHVYVCTGPRHRWSQMWPRLRHYD